MFLVGVAEGDPSPILSTKGLSATQAMELLRGDAGSTVFVELSEKATGESEQPLIIPLRRAPMWEQGEVLRGFERLQVISPPPKPSDFEAHETHLLQITNTIQPDYGAWRAIRPGMTENEVQRLIGTPLRVRGQTNDAYVADFGCVALACEAIPVDLTFSIWFRQGRVAIVEDPFNGQFSTDGTPTKPTTYAPEDGQKFRHYPRIFDLRWYPVSGDYPVSYEVEIAFQTPSGWSERSIGADLPHATFVFQGANQGRWRVRGKNKVGTGPWSEYSKFEFTQ
jgi:hypothetical protein